MIQNYNLNFGTKYPRISKPDLKECLHAGYTYKQIGEKFNVPVGVVERSMQWYGVKSNRALEIEKNTDEVISMYHAGKNIKDIKKELGIPYSKINRIISSELKKSELVIDKTLGKVIKKLNMSDEEVKKYLK